MNDQRVFLSIVMWPDGWTRDDVARLLAGRTGLDTEGLRLRLGAAPPSVVGYVDPLVAAAGVRAIVSAGGEAFAPSLGDLERLGPTLKIRSLRVEGGQLAIDLWRGLSTTLRRDQVQILVRAQVREELVKRLRPMPNVPHIGMHGAPGIAVGMAAAYGVGYAMGIGGSPTERTVRVSEKLDIHTTDGSVYQIDGDKFGFEALGDLRAMGDRTNMDRLCELLAHLAPDEILDPWFALWNPPPGHKQLRIPHMKLNQEDPAFAFYSRWVALMYRHLLGPGR